MNILKSEKLGLWELQMLYWPTNQYCVVWYNTLSQRFYNRPGEPGSGSNPQRTADHDLPGATEVGSLFHNAQSAGRLYGSLLRQYQSLKPKPGPKPGTPAHNKGPEKKLVSGRILLPLYERLVERATAAGRDPSAEVAVILEETLGRS